MKDFKNSQLSYKESCYYLLLDQLETFIGTLQDSCDNFKDRQHLSKQELIIKLESMRTTLDSDIGIMIDDLNNKYGD